MGKQLLQTVTTLAYILGSEGDQEEDEIGYVDDAQLKTFLDLPTDTVAELLTKLEESDIDTLSKLNAILTDATLIDTDDARLPPGNLAGQGGKSVRVNSGETALEYVTPFTSSDLDTLNKLNTILTDATLIDTNDVRLPPSTLTGQGGKVVRVNSGETALEYATPPLAPADQLNVTAVTTNQSFFPVLVDGAGNKAPVIRTATQAWAYNPNTGQQFVRELFIRDTTANAFQFFQAEGTAGVCGLFFGEASGTGFNRATLLYNNGASSLTAESLGAINFNSGGSNFRMQLGANGRLGIGQTQGTYLLELPNVATDAGGRGRSNQWATYSDARIKSNEVTCPYGLEAVLQLRPVEYFQHDSSRTEDKLEILESGARTIGFIAQEVAEVVPQVVNTPENEETDLYAMDYAKLTTVLVKAIQEQQQQIQQLSEKLSKLDKSE